MLWGPDSSTFLKGGINNDISGININNKDMIVNCMV